MKSSRPSAWKGLATPTERDTRLDRTVLLEVLPPLWPDDPDLKARFESEARTVAGLNHPHIYTVHDAARWLKGRNETAFICSRLNVPWWRKTFEFYASLTETRKEASLYR